MEEIKSTIDANITPNGEQGITGSVLNRVLNDMVDATEGKLAQLDQEVENIKVSGIGGCGFAEVAEEGFFFVDAEGYIGASVDSKGFHSINTIEIS